MNLLIFNYIIKLVTFCLRIKQEKKIFFNSLDLVLVIIDVLSEYFVLSYVDGALRIVKNSVNKELLHAT